MNKLSVVVITYNEEKNIQKCLESVQWADEIVVMDQSSTDKTTDLCRSFTEKVYTTTNKGYCDADRMQIIEKASGNWILYIDADERVTNKLSMEIKGLLGSDFIKHDGYFIERKNYIFNRYLRYGSNQDDYQLRLFKKTKIYFTNKIHSQGAVKGTTGKLKNKLEHYTLPDLKSYIRKLNDYTDIEARIMFKSSKTPSKFKIIFYPPLNFLYKYFLKLGFLDGWEGFMYCFLSSFYIFIKYAKFTELIKKEIK